MAHSPVPAKSATMSFAEALDSLVMGKKVRRLEWPTEDYLVMKDEKLMIWLASDKKLHTLIVSLGDIQGDDWIVICES